MWFPQSLPLVAVEVGGEWGVLGSPVAVVTPHPVLSNCEPSILGLRQEGVPRPEPSTP